MVDVIHVVGSLFETLYRHTLACPPGSGLQTALLTRFHTIETTDDIAHSYLPFLFLLIALCMGSQLLEQQLPWLFVTDTREQRFTTEVIVQLLFFLIAQL